MTFVDAQPLPAGDQLADEEIVRRIVAGETPLFEIIVRRYNQRMYRTARAILRDDQDVEDVMQQAYVNAFTHLSQFADRARFSTWLTRIVINEALARLRKSDRHLAIVGEDNAMERLESAGPDPERQAVGSQLREVMEREVAALPDSYRAVFVLREVEGLSTQETADSLSLTEDVVKTRLHRARTMLRDNLYRHAGVTLETLFAFGNVRCDRTVAAVMSRIA